MWSSLLLFYEDNDIIRKNAGRGEGGWSVKKPVWTLRRLEGLTLLLTALFAALTLVWFLLPGGEPAAPTLVEPAHSLRAAEPPRNPEAPGILEGERLDLNTASAADLTRLPGIGEKRARDIVAWREAHGGFETEEGLMEVDGIGEGTYEKVAPYVTVDGETEGGDHGTDPGS